MRGRMTEDQRRLAATHVGIADGVASAMAKRGMPYDECYASALAGLCEAAMRWRPDGGASFPTYAQSRMRGKILDDLRERDYLSRNHRAKEPDHRIGSLSTPLPANNGRRTPVTIAESIAAPITPEDNFNSILSHLPDREHRMVFTLYYAEGMSMKEVGKAIGVGESRVSQIISGALPLLRAKLTP